MDGEACGVARERRKDAVVWDVEGEIIMRVDVICRWQAVGEETRRETSGVQGR